MEIDEMCNGSIGTRLMPGDPVAQRNSSVNRNLLECWAFTDPLTCWQNSQGIRRFLFNAFRIACSAFVYRHSWNGNHPIRSSPKANVTSLFRNYDFSQKFQFQNRPPSQTKVLQRFLLFFCFKWMKSFIMKWR